jgi:Xaa-Pro dipeptidase
MSLPQLDPEFCRRRQNRLLKTMQRDGIGRVVLTRPENVQYLTGFRPHRLMSAMVALDADGNCTLVAPNTEPEGVAADKCVTFEAQRLCTLRQDQDLAAAAKLQNSFGRYSQPSTIAVDFASADSLLRTALERKHDHAVTDIEPELLRLRRKKDPDELAMIRRSIDCTEAMYARAREIIEPGISELRVFNELQSAAVETAGEMLIATGNDYQCNSPGGPPRKDVVAEDGQLYILDLGPCYRGYYADNCRTFAVNRKPTDEQLSAWESIAGVLTMIEETVKPGASAKQLYFKAKEKLDGWKKSAFFHHLGHGIGLYPHEAPHLNSNWDDEFQEGDVFTAEPGLYSEELKAGIRLEQNYLVTADGVERLTSFPLEL